MCADPKFEFEGNDLANPIIGVSLSRSNDVTDAGLVQLKRFTKLRRLSLTHTNVSDAGLVHLKGLKELQTLRLVDTKVSDDGLIHLVGLTKLTTLNLSGTRVTDAGVNKLKAVLPKCKISH